MSDPIADAVDAATRAFNEALNRLGPPPAADYDLARPDPGQSTSAQDLTRARAEAAELTRLLLDARTDRDQWKADAERTMATLRDVALDLQRTKHQNRLLTDGAAAAEPAVQVARQDVGPCARCPHWIVRGQGYEPLPGAKGYLQHVHCPNPEEKP